MCVTVSVSLLVASCSLLQHELQHELTPFFLLFFPPFLSFFLPLFPCSLFLLPPFSFILPPSFSVKGVTSTFGPLLFGTLYAAFRKEPFNAPYTPFLVGAAMVVISLVAAVAWLPRVLREAEEEGEAAAEEEVEDFVRLEGAMG